MSIKKIKEEFLINKISKENKIKENINLIEFNKFISIFFYEENLLLKLKSNFESLIKKDDYVFNRNVILNNNHKQILKYYSYMSKKFNSIFLIFSYEKRKKILFDFFNELFSLYLNEDIQKEYFLKSINLFNSTSIKFQKQILIDSHFVKELEIFFNNKDVLVDYNFNLKSLDFLKEKEILINNIKLEKKNFLVGFKSYLKNDKIDKVLNFIIDENIFLNIENNICKKLLLDIVSIQSNLFLNKYIDINFYEIKLINFNTFKSKYFKIFNKVIINNCYLVDFFKKDLIEINEDSFLKKDMDLKKYKDLLNIEPLYFLYYIDHLKVKYEDETFKNISKEEINNKYLNLLDEIEDTLSIKGVDLFYLVLSTFFYKNEEELSKYTDVYNLRKHKIFEKDKLYFSNYSHNKLLILKDDDNFDIKTLKKISMKELKIQNNIHYNLNNDLEYYNYLIEFKNIILEKEKEYNLIEKSFLTEVIYDILNHDKINNKNASLKHIYLENKINKIQSNKYLNIIKNNIIYVEKDLTIKKKRKM